MLVCPDLSNAAMHRTLCARRNDASDGDSTSVHGHMDMHASLAGAGHPLSLVECKENMFETNSMIIYW